METSAGARSPQITNTVSSNLWHKLWELGVGVPQLRVAEEECKMGR